MYLVTFDGLNTDYAEGQDIFVLGIYDSEELANAAVKKAKRKYPQLKNRFTISNLDTNRTYKITDCLWGQFTDITIGRYIGQGKVCIIKNNKGEINVTSK